jgi:NhaP-type Na+/H+ or K+/H+ antiporter
VFALCVAVILLIGRTINILLVVGLVKLCSKKFQINRYEVFILIISGLVKGATPFALFSSVKLGGNSQYARNEGMVLKTTIIMIIIASSIFLNSLIPKIYKNSLEKL